MTYSITQKGKPLDPSKYTIDTKNKTFSTEECDLVLDFTGLDGWTFKTGYNCNFNTGDNCTFDTESSCTFTTGSNCNFDTGDNCTFDTLWKCTFDTGSYCSFITRAGCTFNTGSHCTFKTGSNCTFKTGSLCTFNTWYNCTFTTGKECVIVRRDVFEVIETPENSTIQLNNYRVKGYTKLPKTKIITIDGKEIEISEDSFNELKKQLT